MWLTPERKRSSAKYFMSASVSRKCSVSHDVGNGLAIIALHPGHARGIGVARGSAEQCREFGLKRVAAEFCEPGEKIGRPIGAVLVGVVIHGARFGAGVVGKGAFEPFK